jgi:TolB protein
MLMIRRWFLVPAAAVSLLTLTQCIPPGGGPPITGLTRVSVAAAGGYANGVSDETAISGNGRYVAFTSAATNIVAGDTNGVTDVFRRDLKTGTTVLVSVAGNGGPANGASSEPAISANGRWVVFTSTGSNFFGSDTNGVADVYIRDLLNGITRRVSVAGGRGQLADPSGNADISADGNLVAFVIHSTFDRDGAAEPAHKVGVRDRHDHVTRVYDSGPAGCPEAGSIRADRDPALGANGRYLAFTIGCTDPHFFFTTSRVIELDRNTGTWAQIAQLSISPDLASGLLGTRYSADGNALAWAEFVSGHGSNDSGVHVRERTSRFMTPDFSKTAAEAERPDLSGDGRFLAYVGGHGPGPFGNPHRPDAVHVIDLANNSIVEASAPPGARQRVAGTGHNPAIDDAGNVVAFSSDEALVTGDNNALRDVYATARASAPPSVVPTIVVYNNPFSEPDTGQTIVVDVFAVAVQNSGTASIPITWHTVDGTAHAPSDYSAVTNGTASVPPNDNFPPATLPVTVRGDNAPEPDETFFVRIEAPAGIRVLYDTGTLTIQNDD